MTKKPPPSKGRGGHADDVRHGTLIQELCESVVDCHNFDPFLDGFAAIQANRKNRKLFGKLSPVEPNKNGLPHE
jgi:hypothetical protein